MADKATVRALAQSLADDLMREFQRARITVDTEAPPEPEDAHLLIELKGDDAEELQELWRMTVVGCQRLSEEHDILVVPRLLRGPAEERGGEGYAGGGAQYWQR